MKWNEMKWEDVKPDFENILENIIDESEHKNSMYFSKELWSLAQKYIEYIPEQFFEEEHKIVILTICFYWTKIIRPNMKRNWEDEACLINLNEESYYYINLVYLFEYLITRYLFRYSDRVREIKEIAEKCGIRVLPFSII